MIGLHIMPRAAERVTRHGRSGRARRSAVDAQRFDRLVRRVTMIRLTRGSVLRGGVVGTVAAITGLSRLSSEVWAKNKKPKKNFCVCTDSTVSSCSDQKVKGKNKKKVLQQFPCSYRGKCRGFNPCSPAPTGGGGGGGPTRPAGFSIAIDLALVGDLCPLGTECGDSSVTGLECVGAGPLAACLPLDLDAVCQGGADCDTGRCDNLLCVLCPLVAICGEAGSEQCCVAEADCIDNLCVLGVG